MKKIFQVFDFDERGDNFEFSADFLRLFKAAENPMIIMFIGSTRAGKSTRLNQLLTKVLRADLPFESLGGADPVTSKFQFCGPLDFSELGQIHGIDLQAKSKTDLFLVDCEGLHSLEKATPGLKKATFALSQMANLTVSVMKDMVNDQNIDSVRAMFALSRAFSREIPGFLAGTVIAMRDIGLRCKRSTPLAEKQQLRLAQDEANSTKIRAVLNEKHVPFSVQELKVICQPVFDEPALYWESTNDLLRFARVIADARIALTPQMLLELVNAAKPQILAITDLENTRVQFEQIFVNVIAAPLAEDLNYALQLLDQHAADPISCLS
jgi:hypothetical protein